MSRIGTSIVVLIAAAVWTFGQPALSAQVEAQSVRVTVVDGNGTSVPGARLELAIPGVPPRSGATGPDGAGDVIGPRQRGVFTISADGFAPFRMAWPPEDGDLTVQLRRSAGLRVLLVDRAVQSPVAGSVAVLLSIPGSRGTFSEAAPDGSAELADLPPGPATLIAKAEGYAPAVVPIELREGLTVVQTVELHAAAVIEGRVLDSDDRPIAGVLVTVDYGSAGNVERLLGQIVGGRVQARTDGTFRLTGIVPNRVVRLRATAGGRVVASSLPLVVGEGETAQGAIVRGTAR